MNYYLDFTTISFYTGMVSLILGIISLILSLYFYNKANQSEVRTNAILKDIESKTSILDKITLRMLDKTISHLSSSFSHLLTSVSQTAPKKVKSISTDDKSVKLSLFNYILRTNFLAKALYAKAENEYTIKFSKEIIRSSYADYQILDKEISQIKKEELIKSPLYDEYVSNKKFYEDIVQMDIESPNK